MSGYDDMLDSRMHDLFDPDPIFSPCGDHQGLWSMPFARALGVARGCDQCYVEEVADGSDLEPGAGQPISGQDVIW